MRLKRIRFRLCLQQEQYKPSSAILYDDNNSNYKKQNDNIFFSSDSCLTVPISFIFCKAVLCISKQFSTNIKH